jgi:hypothetical protein
MWDYYFKLLSMAMLLRLDYELRRPRPRPAVEFESGGDRRPTLLPATIVVLVRPGEGVEEILPWQKEASRRAVKRYADAQEKKWRRWNETMFEQ